MLRPVIPPHLREEFTVLTARHMRGQAQVLFAGFIASLPVAVFGASSGADPVIVYGLPVATLIVALTALFVLRKPLDPAVGAGEAKRTIAAIWRLCLLTAALGGVWAVASWGSAPAESKIYYPAIMSLGALTLGYCLAAVPIIGLTTLLVTLVPMATVLALTGQPLNLVLAGAQMLAVGFQVFLITRHQQLLLSLVEERHKSAAQARRDPLTGLANRRGVKDRFRAHVEQNDHVRLIVVDIDRFKAINDRYGHDVGDEVLRAFAELLRIHARGEICAARLGGEEFGLLGPSAALDPAIALQLLGEIRGAYMPHGDNITASIGVADGMVSEMSDWNRLYGTADRALYRAKNDGRNRVEVHDPALDCADHALEAALSRSA